MFYTQKQHRFTLNLSDFTLSLSSRLESGSEVQFEFEAKSVVDSIKPKEHLGVHETVAECMIFANHWVAKKIAKTFPHQALLRRHPSPSHQVSSSGSSRTLQAYMLKGCLKSKGFNTIIASLLCVYNCFDLLCIHFDAMHEQWHFG